MFGPRNPPASCFFIYGSALLGNALPLRQAVCADGAGGAAAGREAADRPADLVPDPATVISALVGAVWIQAAVNTARELQAETGAGRSRALAKVAERERIARDLHDLLGHTLSVVVLKSELAQKLMHRDPDRALQEMAEVERIAREGLEGSARSDHGIPLVRAARRRSSTFGRRSAAPVSMRRSRSVRWRSTRPRRPRCRSRFVKPRPT